MRCLVWDFDNTLAYRPGLWSQCLAELANEAGGGIAKREQFVPYLGSGFPWHSPERHHEHLSDPEAWWASLHPVLANALVAGANMEPALASTVAGRVRARYTDPGSWVVYPDTRLALHALASRGWRHMVLSNHVPELQQLVAALGLGGHFDRILTSATLGYEKPHPKAYAAAIAALPPDCRIVMVGDSFAADYKGAITAGLEAILVRGSHPECDVALPDLRALVDHLDGA